MSRPSSLQRRVSPPPLKRKRTSIVEKTEAGSAPTLAAIEAGEAVIDDHLDYFVKHLEMTCRPKASHSSRLAINAFGELYQRNQHDHGHHFVVHQHNHPIAGIHYDLRLQFSKTSAVSWAIPYGLPGNPNSMRQGRMAVETRIHNVWNNLIESASHATGSLLVWDTGEYTVLPRKKEATQTDDDLSDDLGKNTTDSGTAQFANEKLIEAFRNRYIRLRLHGARLPPNYTVTLRLPSTNDRQQQPQAPSYKRRQKSSWKPSEASAPAAASSDSDYQTAPEDQDVESYVVATASDEEEASLIRQNNAYSGAENTIGSVHQRHWYMSLDRCNSGFIKDKGRWVRRTAREKDGAAGGFDTFFVRGADFERSVVTGRLSAEIMEDENIESFRPRKMWRPVME